MAGIFYQGQLYGIDSNPAGIPILFWEPGATYYADNLVLHSYKLYQCLEDNSDANFTASKWRTIGAVEGDYGIVATISQLPSGFGSDDLKLFYCITDKNFYLWDGTKWIVQKKNATYNELGCVKVDEETLAIDEDGTLSIRVIQNNSINSLF